jgi:hypothetical protein
VIKNVYITVNKGANYKGQRYLYKMSQKETGTGCSATKSDAQNYDSPLLLRSYLELIVSSTASAKILRLVLK